MIGNYEMDNKNPKGIAAPSRWHMYVHVSVCVEHTARLLVSKGTYALQM